MPESVKKQINMAQVGSFCKNMLKYEMVWFILEILKSYCVETYQTRMLVSDSKLPSLASY